MPRDYRLYLDDILESCRKIRQFTQDMSFQEFERDVKTQDAVIRNFEVIGEAANRLPEDVKALCPEVEWADYWISQHTCPRVFWSQIRNRLDSDSREDPNP